MGTVDKVNCFLWNIIAIRSLGTGMNDAWFARHMLPMDGIMDGHGSISLKDSTTMGNNDE